MVASFANLNSRRWAGAPIRSGVRRLAFGLSGDDVQDLYLGKFSFKRAKAQVKQVVQKVQAPAQKYYGAAGKAVGYAAPIVGMAIGGTAGAAAGTAIGTAAVGATTKGNRQDKWQAAQRFAKYGAAVTAVTGLTSLATGTGITQGFLTKGGPLGPAMPTDAAPSGEWDPVRGEYVQPAAAASGGSDTSWFGKLLGAGAKRLPDGSSGPAMPGGTTVEMPGGSTSFDVSPSGSGGGGGPGGSGAGGEEAKGGETQNLIMLGGAALGLLYLLKR